MNHEKRLAITLTAVSGLLLLLSTAASAWNYDRLLPQVQIVEGSWEEDGFLLPAEALFTGPQGDCVYYVEEADGRAGDRYVARMAFVTVLDRDQAAGTVTVRGIYNPDWVYAAGADLALSDGMEVKASNRRD